MKTITHKFKEGDAVKIEGLEADQRKAIFNKMLKDGCPEYEDTDDWLIDYPFLYWSEMGTYFYEKDASREFDTPWNYLTWKDLTKPIENTPEGKEAATHFRDELTPISELPPEPLSDDLQEDLPETLYSLGGLIKMSQDLLETTLGALNITLQGDGQLLLHGEGFPCIVITDLNPTEINKVLEVMKMLDGKFVEGVQ